MDWCVALTSLRAAQIESLQNLLVQLSSRMTVWIADGLQTFFIKSQWATATTAISEEGRRRPVLGGEVSKPPWFWLTSQRAVGESFRWVTGRLEEVM